MPEKPPNPYAFPTIDFSESGYPYTDRPGMGLRDWFAGQALVGLTNLAGRDPEGEVVLAYRYADAMLAERSKD